MATIDNEYLDDLVKRFKGYKSPNDTQRLIIMLGEKDNRSDDDNRKLAVLLKAEKKADQLAKARADARRMVDAEKAKERKAETRRKVIWGGALKTASKNDPQIAEVMRKLFNEGYISDRDKDAVRGDYEEISAPTVSPFSNVQS